MKAIGPRLMPLAAVLVSLLLLAGCAASPSRQAERYLASHPLLDARTRKGIAEGRIVRGMYPDEAEIASRRTSRGINIQRGNFWGFTAFGSVLRRENLPGSRFQIEYVNRTQFATSTPVKFAVNFREGRVVSILSPGKNL